MKVESVGIVMKKNIDLNILLKIRDILIENNVKIYIEADSQAEYKVIKELIDYLQDTGNSNYYLTTIH